MSTRKFLLRIILFAICNVIAVLGEIYIFQSNFPMLVWPSLIFHLLGLVSFPYNKYFSN